MLDAKHNYNFVNKLSKLENEKFRTIDYIAYSKKRFDFVLNTCKRIKPDKKTRVLDIGRSYLSYLLADYYDEVTTLGFALGDHGYSHEYNEKNKLHEPKSHIVFDLNDAQVVGTINTDYKFDLIVFAEVIEHLHTAPEIVLNFLKNILSENGMIVLQTPNATALPKRLRLLRGINPYERIRIIKSNPGHFREYTKQELIEIGHIVNLDIIYHSYDNFPNVKDNSKLIVRIKSSLLGILCYLYKPFMSFQTIVYTHKLHKS
ncbi:MAG: methyltransferase domain-containing protein [Bacteroidia bacterium]|nr:methyltransferase domain-containing protein [Bacteroidia bacterium]